MKTTTTQPTQTTQIKNSTLIATETPGNLYKIEKKFNNVIKNTKRFNTNFLRYVNKTTANGKQFLAYTHDGELLLEWALTGDRNGYELTVITYKRK